jgi:outer membrane protein OmpA-like peptidoglycan-associated protein/5-hydroxyisourate hydrolase-like protein (transthyretin family)
MRRFLLILLISGFVLPVYAQPMLMADASAVRSVHQSGKAIQAGYDTARFSIRSLKLNTHQADFLPVFFNDGLYFMRAKAKPGLSLLSLEWPAKPRLNTYFIPHQDSIKDLKKVQLALQYATEANYGAASYVSNIAKVYFTKGRNRTDKQKKISSRKPQQLQIYAAKESQHVWYSLEPFPFNTDSFSVAHPSLSPDGQVMIFASDMPGGFGGSDLYISRRDELGNWMKPVNLGETVNSAHNELFPFLHEDGNLYFASDRPGGLGGYDVYEAIKSIGGYSRLVNMGTPFNSSADDFGFIANEPKRITYVTSNRNGGQGSYDIYEIQVHLLHISRNITDDGENLFGHLELEVSGQVIDSVSNTPIKRALVKIRDFNNDDIKVTFTDDNGRYRFRISNENKFQIASSKIGYQTTRDYLFSTYGIAEEVPLNYDIVMTPLNYKLKLRVTVKDNTEAGEVSGMPIAGALLKLEDMNGELPSIERLADLNGIYTFELEQGKVYKLTASLDGYVSSLPFRISTDNTTNSRTIEVSVNLTKEQKFSSAPCEVRVRVLDKSGNDPIPFANVLLKDNNGKSIARAVSDENGWVTFKADTSAHYLIEAIKSGFQLEEYLHLRTHGDEPGSSKEMMLYLKPVDYSPVPLDLSIDPVYFQEARSVKDNDVEQALSSIAQLLEKYPSIKVRMVAHADKSLNTNTAMEVSRQRSTFALNYLLGQGISRTRILKIENAGNSNPLVECKPGECTEGQLRQNRRIEFFIMSR